MKDSDSKIRISKFLLDFSIQSFESQVNRMQSTRNKIRIFLALSTAFLLFTMGGLMDINHTNTACYGGGAQMLSSFCIAKNLGVVFLFMLLGVMSYCLYALRIIKYDRVFLAENLIEEMMRRTGEVEEINFYGDLCKELTKETNNLDREIDKIKDSERCIHKLTYIEIAFMALLIIIYLFI